MEVMRGDVVIVVPRGDLGKPRPGVVVQANHLNAIQPTVLICLMTSDLENAPAVRVTIEPSQQNGLKTTTQVMVDKLSALPRTRIKARIGTVTEAQLGEIGASLKLCLGLV